MAVHRYAPCERGRRVRGPALCKRASAAPCTTVHKTGRSPASRQSNTGTGTITPAHQRGHGRGQVHPRRRMQECRVAVGLRTSLSTSAMAKMRVSAVTAAGRSALVPRSYLPTDTDTDTTPTPSPTPTPEQRNDCDPRVGSTSRSWPRGLFCCTATPRRRGPVLFRAGAHVQQSGREERRLLRKVEHLENALVLLGRGF